MPTYKCCKCGEVFEGSVTSEPYPPFGFIYPSCPSCGASGSDIEEY